MIIIIITILKKITNSIIVKFHFKKIKNIILQYSCYKNVLIF